MTDGTRRWVITLATCGPVGRLPIAPGSWGSVAACAIWWPALSKLSIGAQAGVILLTIPLAIWASGVAERSLGHDAKPIVIDEVVGQWMTLLVCPRELVWMGVGFFLFRLFDVVKPFPARPSQQLPGGIGVVIDDLVAAVYSVAALFLIHWLWRG